MEFKTSVVKIDNTIYLRIPYPLAQFLSLSPTQDVKIIETGDKQKLTVILP